MCSFRGAFENRGSETERASSDARLHVATGDTDAKDGGREFCDRSSGEAAGVAPMRAHSTQRIARSP